jgi:hypothetical protein
MSLSCKNHLTQSSCLKTPRYLPMLPPLETMLRLLDVALSQNPDITFQCPVLPISPTTFYISKNHDIPSVSSSPNPPKTIHVVCANSRRPTVNVRLHVAVREILWSLADDPGKKGESEGREAWVFAVEHAHSVVSTFDCT